MSDHQPYLSKPPLRSCDVGTGLTHVPEPTTGVKVRARKPIFYRNSLRERGDEFFLTRPADFDSSCMVRLSEPPAPPKAATRK